MLYDNLLELESYLSQSLNDYSPELLCRFPIEKYIKYLDDYPLIEKYGYVSPEVEQYCEQIIDVSDIETLGIYHKLLLLKLISISEEKIFKDEYLTAYVKKIFSRNFSRIIKNIEVDEDLTQYLYSNDKFRKSLAICSRRLLPVGAQKVNTDGFSKRFIFKKGIMQFIRASLYILFE